MFIAGRSFAKHSIYSADPVSSRSWKAQSFTLSYNNQGTGRIYRLAINSAISLLHCLAENKNKVSLDDAISGRWAQC